MLAEIDVWTGYLALGASYLLGFLAAAHAVMYKRDPRSAAIWVLINITIPLVGAWLYYSLGINRIERRALKRFGRRGLPFGGTRREAEAGERVVNEAVAHLTSLRDVADRVTRLPLLHGNRITPLHNGEEAYPRMLAAIDGATKTLTLASYIFDWDDVGRNFAEALDRAARRGVKVHVLVDSVGALGHFSRMGRRLMKSHVRVAAFFPLRFPFGRVRVNLRNHRKILVVDGVVGFTGGMNISARHMVSRGDPKCSADLHFELTGPVVGEMQHTFAEDWALATDELLDGEEYFPEIAPDGPAVCRGLASGPDENFEIIHLVLLAAFAAARKSIRIVTPYFIPTQALVSAINMASLRGVDVSLTLPSLVDHQFMRWAADAYLWELLSRGVRVHRQPPPFVHTKLLIVDDRWVLIGSANLDRRSFRLNFEFNVESYDPILAASLSQWVDQVNAGCQTVTLEDVDARSLPIRLRDGVAKLFSPHL